MILQGVVCYLLTVNAAAFLLMQIDKQKAKKHMWRIPQRVLLLSAVLGGSIGALAGMYVFRHKTRKPLFYLGIPLILAIQLLCSALLLAEYL